MCKASISGVFSKLSIVVGREFCYSLMFTAVFFFYEPVNNTQLAHSVTNNLKSWNVAHYLDVLMSRNDDRYSSNANLVSCTSLFLLRKFVFHTSSY